MIEDHNAREKSSLFRDIVRLNKPEEHQRSELVNGHEDVSSPKNSSEEKNGAEVS